MAEELEGKFFAGLTAVRRMAGIIAGQPFASGAASSAAMDLPTAHVEEIQEEEREKRNEEGNKEERRKKETDQLIEGNTTDGDEWDSSEEDDDASDSSSEGPKSEEEIARMIDWLVEIESEAAEAQEHLEDEKINNLREEVRIELAEKLSGQELEMAVAHEMANYTELWEQTHVELEEESGRLQDRLECVGVSLPALYKYIEKEAPRACITETWKKRVHWAGTEAHTEFAGVLHSAEKELDSLRPVMRQRGKLVEEGASGFLQKKVPGIDADNGWEVYDTAIEPKLRVRSSFDSERWTAVYSASTPQQAARMGLNFPGFDKVDDIADVDQKVGVEARALAEESEFGLTDQQKRNMKRVREEDDVRKMHRKGGLTSGKQHVSATISQPKPSVSNNLDVRAHRPDILQHKKAQTEQMQCKEKNSFGKLPPSSDPNPVDLKRSTSGSAPTGTQPATNEAQFQSTREKRSLEKTGPVTSSKPAAGSIIELSDDDDSSPPADCGSTVQTEHLTKDSLVTDETTSPLKPLKRTIEGGGASSGYKKRKIVIDCSDDDEGLRSTDKKESGDSKDLSNGHTEASDMERSTRGNKFNCTVCSKTLSAKDVFCHAVLQVIVCKSCKEQYDSWLFTQDEDGSEAECRWCCEGGNVICCDTCDKVFCEACISRNFGSDILDTISNSDWNCFLCDPLPLQNLRQLLKSAEEEQPDLRKIEVMHFRKHHRKNIRKMMTDDDLDDATKEKLALEKERRKRLETWYEAAKASGKCQSYGKSVTSKKAVEENDEVHLCEGNCKVEGCAINIASRGFCEPVVRIPASISKCLKPHQLSGVRFMWENCIETIEKVKSGAEALGCILAHSMGLGKTLQVIAFLYTVMRNVDFNFKTVLIVVPVNVLHNWQRELYKWRPAEIAPLEVYMLDIARDNVSRANVLKSWIDKGGVMLIGYAAFRNLSTGCHVKDKNIRDLFCECLQNPGPDLLVCDEAHTIKNKKADITIALEQVKTRRRIALTGSPLQNNLMEYYCMVDFVRHGFLGPPQIFRNRFQNPIANGQHADSTTDDVKKMKRCSYVLHQRLKGFVQRRDMNVLKKDLPPKCVWVISVRLSALQKKLYRTFLKKCENQRSKLFDHYHVLSKIWNHPDLLSIAKEQLQNEHFIVDSDSEELVPGAELTKPPIPEVDNYEWCDEILKQSRRDVLENSGKMILIMRLLSLSISQGDKMLIFSQSLGTLDLIEKFLATIPLGTGPETWRKGQDWHRLDGGTSAVRRQQIADSLNDENNTVLKCLLISTKAGSLGINMTGANRVVIVDGSWNPTHDLQALFRSWRYGQKKPVYAYRLLAYGTMEEKVYNRQLTKEGIAARVLDAHQVGRHLNADELELLYTLHDDEDENDAPTAEEDQQKVQKPKNKTFSLPPDTPPRDEHMALLLLDYRPRWIVNYHEHEPLLEELEEEKLTAEDKSLTWEVFISEHEQAKRQQEQTTPSVTVCDDIYHANLLQTMAVAIGSSAMCWKCLKTIAWDIVAGSNTVKQ